MKNISSAKLVFLALLIGYIKYCPEKSHGSINVGDKQMAYFGSVPKGESVPNKAISISDFTGYWINNQGAKLYMDMAKGLWLFIEKNQAYYFEVSATNRRSVEIDYTEDFANDIVTLENDGRMSFANVHAPRNKVYYKKLK